MQSNLLERTVSDVLSAALEAADEELLVIDAGTETLEELVDRLENEGPSVRLLAEKRTLKSVMDDFIVASRAADHVADGRLELYVHESGSNTAFVTQDAVVAVVRGDDMVAGLTTDDETFVESANARFEREFEESEEFSLRTPPFSRVLETLEDDLGEETASDFETMLSSLGTARGDGEGLDEVTISLLVTARNEDLLYDVSKWGEDVGIASKATFSRTKTRMEDAGLIDTEKVPIDVGRPRLRLKLADDERLQSADPGELAEIAASMLES